VQNDAVADGDFRLDNRRMRPILHVNQRVVLNVRTIADADEVNVAAHGAVAPDRSVFAEMDIADYLSTWIDVGSWVNLWMNPAKGSNHDFGEIVT